MEIPVCNLTKRGLIIGYIAYDTSINKFKDKLGVYTDRVLPFQDYYVPSDLDSHNIVTLVGKDYKYNMYIICFGDNFLFSIDKSKLLRYKISNAKLTKDYRIFCIDGKLPDLSYMFPDRGIQFISLHQGVQNSSQGIAKKFFGLYKNKYSIVKFSKISSSEDLDNEILYKNLADILKVPCCKVYKSVYYNKPCCISNFEYDIGVDYFQSFKSTNKRLEEILNRLDKKSKQDLDKILLLDYLVNQQDRHLSNIALCNDRIYPAFDNGECFNLGSIGYFSENFRRYIERLDKRYLYSLVNLDLKRIKNILPSNKFIIFYNNYKYLFRSGR